MPDRPDDLERAYRDAVRLLDDEVGAKRRRRAVLAAVKAAGPISATAARQASDPSASADPQPGAGSTGATAPTTATGSNTPPPPRRAANEAQWQSGASWWRGAAAASVLVTSALLVLHGLDEPPGAGVERRAPERAAEPASTVAAQPAIPEAEQKSKSARPANGRSALATPPAVADARADAAAPAPPGLAQAAPVAALPAAFPAQATTATGPVGLAAPPPQEPLPASKADGATAQSAESARDQAELAALRDQGFKAMAPRSTAKSFAPAAPASLPTQMSAARNARIAATSSVPAALMGQPLVAESANAAGGAARPAPGSGLLEAAAAGDADALENLLKRVAPDAERDAQGRTALALAVLRSDSRSVMLLLAHGADRHRADWHGQTPLDAALRLADPAVLKALGLP